FAMCAIAGIFHVMGEPVDLGLLGRMIERQAHRGPDGEGYVLLSASGREPPYVAGRAAAIASPGERRYPIGLGHRRLAIVDLSEGGHQPMATEDGHCWITYNGEIYNYLELRAELKALGHRFRSESDTEVLLAAYRQWGSACLERFNGMFAFALWDGRNGRLFCARDRFGEKPFYYVWDGARFAFASEIKGLLPFLGQPRPNHRAVYAYLDGGSLDYADSTFFEDVRQLPPAHYLVVGEGKLTTHRYWRLPESESTPRNAQPEDVERFRQLFQDAVRLRLRCDVPVGSCLSGGLDSSSIVCVANTLLRNAAGVPSHLIGARQKTFSSCFEDPAYDERRFIRFVVERTGAEPHYAFPDPKEFVDTVARVVRQQEEPFGSTSIFAQWTVMRLAAQHGIRVLLDGQGADEVLAGYHGFFGAWFADFLVQGRWRRLWEEWRAYRQRHGALPPQAMANVARALLPRIVVRTVRPLMTGSAAWLAPEFRRRWKEESAADQPEGSHLQAMQRRLLERNGLRALLHYEDRNAMAFGIEPRLPFLDHRLVESVFALPSELKLHEGWTKVLLRKAMEGILPDPVQWRADKLGFATPEDEWFRTTLREMAQDILFDSRTRSRGYFNVDAMRREFEAHLAGRKNLGFVLWRWLNIELWCREFADGPACAAPWC
ncbi:MAG TPA: asparagine synthase (glutamine-hydrolyzing), partial [Nitrospiraceae bacterium]|nr:asparagine synthase (glutamine-hydrolyzing) [Nitrospiraceae bacterium]